MSVSSDLAAYEAQIGAMRALADTTVPGNKKSLFDARAAAGIAAYAWLRDVLSRMVDGHPPQRPEKLLPWKQD